MILIPIFMKIDAVASRCFPHPILSLFSPRMEMRSVDLANWALRTSPKFTTGVKYQYRQGFLPDQRSEIPINLRPHIYIYHQSILPKGRSFTVKAETKVAVMSKGKSSTANSGTKAAVLLGMNRYDSFPLLSAPHSLFSI